MLNREKQGEIQALRKHVLYRFKVGAYEADFVYIENGKTIVEDVKHPWLLKQRKFLTNRRKMMLEYGLYVYALRPEKVKQTLKAALY